MNLLAYFCKTIALEIYLIRFGFVVDMIFIFFCLIFLFQKKEKRKTNPKIPIIFHLCIHKLPNISLSFYSLNPYYAF